MRDDSLVFEVQTPLGFRVRLTRARWDLIASVKHPIMTGREMELKAVLESPDQVRTSRTDPAVFLFYQSERVGRWICAVVKRENGVGLVVTAYRTDAIKAGVPIWPK